MDAEIFGLSPMLFALAVAVTLFAGFVKGAVGFALPMIMISGLSSFLPAPTALAALILATLVANTAQALRQGWRAAWGSVCRFWRLELAVVTFIFISAPLVTILPGWALSLMLGLPILAFTLSQLMGRHLILKATHRNRAEFLMGSIGGFFGGISGVWGPPVVAYLLSFNIEKKESIRVQGVVYMVGAFVLLGSHLNSGVLNARTLPLSAALVVPASLGLWLGFLLQDRLDPDKFRKATLVILALAGANLVRKGLIG